MNPPISNDKLLVPDPERPGNKIRVSKFLLQISIRELHNNLMSEISICPLKDAIYDKIGNPLISDTSLRPLIPNNVRKFTGKFKILK